MPDSCLLPGLLLRLGEEGVTNPTIEVELSTAGKSILLDLCRFDQRDNSDPVLTRENVNTVRSAHGRDDSDSEEIIMTSVRLVGPEGSTVLSRGGS